MTCFCALFIINLHVRMAIQVVFEQLDDIMNFIMFLLSEIVRIFSSSNMNIELDSVTN